MTPMGVPIKVAKTTMTKEPQMALAKPPTSLGGGVICVNRARLMPPKPKRKVSIRIQINQNTPKAMAATAKIRATVLTRLRLL